MSQPKPQPNNMKGGVYFTGVKNEPMKVSGLQKIIRFQTKNLKYKKKYYTPAEQIQFRYKYSSVFFFFYTKKRPKKPDKYKFRFFFFTTKSLEK